MGEPQTRRGAGPGQSRWDRRRKPRFPLQLRCRVSSCWGTLAGMAGTTRDISRCGALVEFRDLPPTYSLPAVGEEALLEIDLPNAGNFTPRRLQCVARVVRVTGADSKRYAVAFDFGRVII